MAARDEHSLGLAVLDWHRGLAWVLIGCNAAAGVWALAAYLWPALRGRPLWALVIACSAHCRSCRRSSAQCSSVSTTSSSTTSMRCTAFRRSSPSEFSTAIARAHSCEERSTCSTASAAVHHGARHPRAVHLTGPPTPVRTAPRRRRGPRARAATYARPRWRAPALGWSLRRSPRRRRRGRRARRWRARGSRVACRLGELRRAVRPGRSSHRMASATEDADRAEAGVLAGRLRRAGTCR